MGPALMRRLLPLLLGLLWLPCAAVEEVPAAVAATLTAVEEQLAVDPAAALATLEAHAGEAHPLLGLARGRALLLLERPDEAVAAFEAVLAARPELEQARRGLLSAQAARRDWAALLPLCAAWIAVESAAADELGLYLEVALQLGDAALASALAERALLRFPGERALRHQAAAAAQLAGAWARAADLLDGLLAVEQGDLAAWRRLAAIRQRQGDAAGSRVALEAASLLDPEDRALRRSLALARLAAGQAAAALPVLRELIAEAAEPERPLLLEGVHAAELAGAPAEARAWLDRLPADDPQAALGRARLALAAGEVPAARAALNALLGRADLDPLVPLWLARLDEQAGEPVRAEAHVRAALALAGPDSAAARLARLHLLRLLIRGERRAEAQTLLAELQAAHPADPAVAALAAALGD